jgi:3-oxoacyl-[acyl-carrier protein] reductase
MAGSYIRKEDEEMGVLEGKAAVVSGSGQGIGRAIALALAEEGAKVVTNNRKAGAEGGDAETVANEIKAKGGTAIPVFADVASFSECERLIKTCVDNFGKIDILVNNAGFDRPRMIWNMTEEDWDLMLNCMLKGAFSCSRFACGYMRQQRWGRIIMITSEAYRGTVGHVNYGAAKGGLVGLVRAIAREMGRYGVTANAVCPTAKTRFSYNPGVLEGIKKRVEKGIMPKEQYEEVLTMPGPEYLTPMVVYLASEAGANVNGRVFSAMGGKLSLHLEPYDEKVLWKDHLKYGPWAQEELAVQIPKTFALTNPFPPEKE